MTTESPPPSKIRRVEGGGTNGDGDDSRDMDAETQRALEMIDSIQNDIDALNEKASEEILQVEQKYNKLRKPHFDMRSEIIQSVPNFWVTCFINHPQISAVMDEDEEECLQFLDKVEVEEFEDIKSGYRVKFHFKENAYFTNKELCKEFHLGTSGDPASQSVPIKWNKGFDLVAKADAKQKANNVKRRDLLSRTFFQWYNDNTDPSADDIAEVIKDDMWPNPLQYFLAPDAENGLDSEEDEDDDEDPDESVEVIGEDDDEDVEEISDEDVEEIEDSDEDDDGDDA